MRQLISQVYMNFIGDAVANYRFDWVSFVVIASLTLVALAWGTLMVRELLAYHRRQAGGGPAPGPGRFRWN